VTLKRRQMNLKVAIIDKLTSDTSFFY